MAKTTKTPAAPKNAPAPKAAPAKKNGKGAAPAKSEATPAVNPASKDKLRFWVPVVVTIVSKPAESPQVAALEVESWIKKVLIGRLNRDNLAVLGDHITEAQDLVFTKFSDDGDEYAATDWDKEKDEPKPGAKPLPANPNQPASKGRAAKAAAAALPAPKPPKGGKAPAKKPAKAGK